MFLNNKIDLNKINKYIEGLKNKNTKEKINGFFYENNGIENYISKVFEIIKKSKLKFDKKLSQLFKKVLFDKHNQFGNIRTNEIFERDFKNHPSQFKNTQYFWFQAIFYHNSTLTG